MGNTSSAPADESVRNIRQELRRYRVGSFGQEGSGIPLPQKGATRTPVCRVRTARHPKGFTVEMLFTTCPPMDAVVLVFDASQPIERSLAPMLAWLTLPEARVPLRGVMGFSRRRVDCVVEWQQVEAFCKNHSLTAMGIYFGAQPPDELEPKWHPPAQVGLIEKAPELIVPSPLTNHPEWATPTLACAHMIAWYLLGEPEPLPTESLTKAARS
mmetsp:Transcript_40718/g.102506  ORF Transcript_40718/g.102506 Transcript_40718/m.102506 type:complete len:213 (+) Transcript_40718:115-753(+)|eukprot:CAMPEP_0174236678 /NCGR_PEP_ID=MMETSP0417-20130205/5734_1 /TAXON_ID=242541 /ORGANISM="Mayorella sp, Strain BSH-02190019" /LENGTH=212 /DNA_ID=CAMNT_0015315351 /DNA_START=83 /DNA_END=721 /DNA_ORIENTATION=+